MGEGSFWPPLHSDALRGLVAKGLSYGQACRALNAKFGTSYTRNGCIGRGHRMGLGSPRIIPTACMSNQERNAAGSRRKRLKRWAANPLLAGRYERLQERKQSKSCFLDDVEQKSPYRSSSKTSAGHRLRMPRAPKMTSGELRAMLTQAVKNTAAMEIAA